MDIDDLIVTLVHGPGDHGHFWDIDQFLPKLVNNIVNGHQPLWNVDRFLNARAKLWKRHLFNPG